MTTCIRCEIEGENIGFDDLAETDQLVMWNLRIFLVLSTVPFYWTKLIQMKLNRVRFDWTEKHQLIAKVRERYYWTISYFIRFFTRNESDDEIYENSDESDNADSDNK